LIQGKIVFVPIQYRLGTLGILGDGSKEFGGNVAMFDMHAALQWVKEYISFFGGDPRQIKVMGHGSGSSAAMHLSSSPMGRSSMNGVIAMSGSSLSQYSYDVNATLSEKEIAEAHKCPHKNEIEMLNCLRNKPIEEIIAKDSSLQVDRLAEKNMIKAMNGMLTFAPNIELKDDQRGLPGIITMKPEESLKKDPESNKIPLLIGVTKHETANGINTNEILKIYNSGTEFLKATAESLKFDGLLNAPKQIGEVFKSLGKGADINPVTLLKNFKFMPLLRRCQVVRGTKIRCHRVYVCFLSFKLCK
jgi:carboxylesterase type B